jgi:hypothetical protein
MVNLPPSTPFPTSSSTLCLTLLIIPALKIGVDNCRVNMAFSANRGRVAQMRGNLLDCLYYILLACALLVPEIETDMQLALSRRRVICEARRSAGGCLLNYFGQHPERQTRPSVDVGMTLHPPPNKRVLLTTS